MAKIPTSAKLGKDDLDRFYTKPEVVDRLLKEVDVSKYDVIIEPSAGSGSWSNKLVGCVSIDIAPAHDNITQGDFLSEDISFDHIKEDKKIIVIGNPPFGRQSKLAKKFINKSAEFADTIAFILPRSFRKESVQRHIHKNFWLTKDIDLFEDSAFIFEGKDYFAPCVFQVWERREEERNTKVEKVDPVGWDYTKREYCNIVIRRVGGAAGTAYLDNLKEKSIQPNYFLSVPNPTKLADEINKHSFDIYDTVGPQSLTKKELTSFINSFINNHLQKNKKSL